MKVALIIVLVALVSIGSSATPFEWKLCMQSDNPSFKVTSVVMEPYPAIAGKMATVHSTGMKTEAETGGTWSTTVLLDGLPVHHFTGSICDPPLIPSCPCPCKPGNYTTSQSMEVPSYAITDTYTGQYIAKDENGKLVSCISYEFSIENN
mmetsp:Transcript_12816/g.14234  ORF Transcript_12816/g.14234 Transcript_12816/m.14234 type:complete len:150 (-) Transcript_12816:81-530(-)